MQTLEHELYQAFANGAIIPNRKPLDEWCKSNVFLPSPPFNPSGYLELSRSKYLVEPLLALQNPDVHEVVAVGNPRSGKTLLSNAFLLYTIKEDPADILLTIHKKEKIKELLDIRLLPFLHANRVTFADYKSADKTESATQRLIKFDVGTLRFSGAFNATDFNMLGARVLIGDEVHEWTEGILDVFKRRSNDFRYTKQILVISQACDHGKDFHREYLKGSQAVWGFKCPECGEKQIFHFQYKRPQDGQWAGFRFDEIKNSKDEWDIPAAAASARYECINCLTKFFDPKDRHVLNENGIYIPQNPNAPEEIKSYLWNALATEIISYDSIVKDYLNAKRQVERNRYEDMRTFHLQVLSNFYHLGLSDGQLDLKIGEDIGEDGKEGQLFLGVDVGKEVLYYTVVAFFKEKREMRLIEYGKIPKDWNVLETIQRDNGVSHRNVLVDSGAFTTDVYRACASKYKRIVDPISKRERRQGWLATKGEEPKDGHYPHVDKKYRPYAPIQKVETASPDKQEKIVCRLMRFATSPIRTILQELIDGKHPQWKLLFNAESASDETFKEHLKADQPTHTTNKRTNQPVLRWECPSDKENHYADCLNLCTLAGVHLGYL